MTFLQLLHKPGYVWDLEEIEREQTDPTGYINGLDHIDTVNDFIAHTMLTRHHQVAADIHHYINSNTWTILPKPFT